MPACAQDAARVAARRQPELRTVTVGSRRVPYWEAGAAYLPYSRGYFAAAAAHDVRAVSFSWALAAPSSDLGTAVITEGPGAAGFGGDWGGGFDVGDGGDGGGGSW